MCRFCARSTCFEFIFQSIATMRVNLQPFYARKTDLLIELELFLLSSLHFSCFNKLSSDNCILGIALSAMEIKSAILSRFNGIPIR